MNAPHVVSMQAVRKALLMSKMRLVALRVFRDDAETSTGAKYRWAAYSMPQGAMTADSRTCTGRTTVICPGLRLMSRGDLPNLLETVYAWRGKKEVLRIWGAGVRALRIEFDGAMP